MAAGNQSYDEKEPETKDGPNPDYWRAQLEAYDRAASKSLKATDAAWDEYTIGENQGAAAAEGEAKEAARYPLYWSCCRVLRPALYSRTPIPDAHPAFDDLREDISRLGGICVERRASYLMRACSYDRVMYATRDNYIHGGKATCRVCFDSESPEQQTGADGAPVPLTPGQAQSYMKSLKCDLVAVNYRDIKHTPNARIWDEITWISFDSWMTKPTFAEKFGEATAELVKFTELSNKSDQDKKSTEVRIPQLGCTVTEIWNKGKREVLWLAKDYKEFIKPTNYGDPDPYQLGEFFPCVPFMLGTTGAKHLFPTTDFAQLAPFFNQLNGAAARLRSTLWAARKVGLVDGDIEALKALEHASDGEFVFVPKLRTLLGDGDLENVVKFFPTKELMESAKLLIDAADRLEQKVYELWGIPDILRGISDPQETAAAQQQKGKFISGMFSATQREFQRVNRDAIQLMVDLASTKFPRAKRAQIDGVQFMSIEDQALWPQVDALLADDDARLIMLDIQTDSTITMNENAEIEQSNYLAKTTLEGLDSVSKQQNPAMALIALEVAELAIGKLRNGKKVIQNFKPLREQIEKELAAPPAPPPPDPVMIKAQADIALAQKKLEGDMQLQQLKTQGEFLLLRMKTQAEIYREDRKAANAMQFEQLDAAHQQQLKESEAELKKLDAMFTFALQKQKADDAHQEQRQKSLDTHKEATLGLIGSVVDMSHEREKHQMSMQQMKAQPKAAA